MPSNTTACSFATRTQPPDNGDPNWCGMFVPCKKIPRPIDDLLCSSNPSKANALVVIYAVDEPHPFLPVGPNPRTTSQSPPRTTHDTRWAPDGVPDEFGTADTPPLPVDTGTRNNTSDAVITHNSCAATQTTPTAASGAASNSETTRSHSTPTTSGTTDNTGGMTSTGGTSERCSTRSPRSTRSEAEAADANSVTASRSATRSRRPDAAVVEAPDPASRSAVATPTSDAAAAPAAPATTPATAARAAAPPASGSSPSDRATSGPVAPVEPSSANADPHTFAAPESPDIETGDAHETTTTATNHNLRTLVSVPSNSQLSNNR